MALSGATVFAMKGAPQTNVKRQSPTPIRCSLTPCVGLCGARICYFLLPLLDFIQLVIRRLTHTTNLTLSFCGADQSRHFYCLLTQLHSAVLTLPLFFKGEKFLHFRGQQNYVSIRAKIVATLEVLEVYRMVELLQVTAEVSTLCTVAAKYTGLKKNEMYENVIVKFNYMLRSRPEQKSPILDCILGLDVVGIRQRRNNDGLC